MSAHSVLLLVPAQLVNLGGDGVAGSGSNISGGGGGGSMAAGGVARAPRPRTKLALLNAQWRGGSTLAEQLIFSTTVAPPFLLDEPAKAMWHDENHHTVASVLFNALRCDFSQYNHTHLLAWQHWRGEFTKQRKLLNYNSFAQMRRYCQRAGTGGRVRAVKTIRMTGTLSAVAKSCVRERSEGNYSCVLIQLVRHPLSTLKSERSSAMLPQARGVLDPTRIAPGSSEAWLDARSGNLSSFCAPILRDIKTVLALRRRAARYAKKGLDASAIPRAVLLRHAEMTGSLLVPRRGCG